MQGVPTRNSVRACAMLGLLCGLVLLVNLTTVVAIGYGGPDDFVLKENAKGGLYRVGPRSRGRRAARSSRCGWLVILTWRCRARCGAPTTR